ncbi:MAG TPA: tetratricopeptide repeat protein [Pyrinomonadaceae bacterium]|nr:tetratricopeptide repeat protein [Pyrinomonadaceae bacterium]
MRARLSCIKARLRAWRRRARAARPSAGKLVLLSVALLAASAGVALGCGWVGTEHSVRFNAWLSEAEFSRLPPLPFTARGPKKATDEGDLWEAAQARSKRAAAAWVEAAGAAAGGDHARLRDLLGEYLKLTAGPDCGSGDAAGDCRWRRRAAFDQLDVLSSAGGADPAAVNSYLEARRAYDAWAAWVSDGDAMSSNMGSNQDARASSWSMGTTPGAPTPAEGEAGAPTSQGAAGSSGAAGPSGAAGGAERQDAEPSAAEQARAAEHRRRAEEVRELLGRVPRGVGLDDNVAYLRAAVTEEEGAAGLDESVLAFESAADSYPRGEKSEAALFSAAMMRLRASRAWQTASSYAAPDEADPALRDRDWSEAARLFRRVLAAHGRGRYAADARGWLAYLHLRVGETGEALAEYYRALASAPDEATREEALRSLRLVRRAATEDDLTRLERLIEGEPRTALVYAYHNVYNYALRGAFDVYVEDEENPYNHCRGHASSRDTCADKFFAWEQAESTRRRAAGERKELARVGEFAARMMRRHPAAGVGAGFALRVAAIKLELGEHAAARDLARRALALGPDSDEERAAALWTRGVAEYRLRDYAAARRTLVGLAEEFPDGDLAEGARRFVALAAEDAGDIEGALEQYLALGYEADAAYFLDVLMTPEQVASFVERRPEHPRRDVLLYSLGLRYMRLHCFDEARAAFARVRTSAPTGNGGHSYDNPCAQAWRKPQNTFFNCLDPKEPDDEEPGVVLARWVARDLRTMEEIEARERAAELAAGDEAKAEALYQLAGYYYGASELVFYNPAAWRGGRFFALYYDYEPRAPGEPRLLRRYMEQHERLVHALGVYLRVAREYPQTRAARDSLYTAAVIHERLAHFMLFWPAEYRLGMQAGERMVTYADVRRAYPGYQLPRGTWRWEPATRTVGGGPGWDVPRRETPTGMERARRKIRRAEAYALKGWVLFGEVAGGRARRWSLVLLFSAGALLLLRLTRRSRALLLDLFVRAARARDRRPAGFVRVPGSSYGAHHGYAASARAGEAAARAWRALREVALDERGRVALAVNLFTHGLLTALVYAAAWALRSV